MARLDQFVALLAEENERQNLIAAATLPIIWQRHIADSAQLLTHVAGNPASWLDLGSGAGFPGIVISIMRPDWPVFLVESRRRRIDWLRACCDILGLDHCEVLGDRLENVPGFPVSIISARAFAPLDRLLDLSARFSTNETVWLLPKGRNAALELADLPKKTRAMFHVEHSLTDRDAGIIVGKLAQEAKRPS